MSAEQPARDRMIEALSEAIVDHLIDHPELMEHVLSEIDEREMANTVLDAWRGR